MVANSVSTTGRVMGAQRRARGFMECILTRSGPWTNREAGKECGSACVCMRGGGRGRPGDRERDISDEEKSMNRGTDA